MPTRTWVGKDKVVNHHHEVPFKVLQQQSRFDSPDGSPTQATATITDLAPVTSLST